MVITIQSPDGDMIDCVHKKKQPAFDHPLLKNHKIQKEPPERPKMRMVKIDGEKEGNRKNGKEEIVRELEWQMWHLNGTRCPKGTIPIRRSTVHDVLRSKSLFDFGKKRHKSLTLAKRGDSPDVVNGNGHEHAIAYTGTSGEIYGARATINVWDPSIEEVNEFSLSQIWVLSGNFDGSDLNSIEAGWQSGQSGALW
ncbi:DNA-directed RNA polymerase subunit beta [Bienertia sinuspersici]